MKTLFAILLAGSFICLISSGCSEGIDESFPRDVILSIDAPDTIDFEICDYIDTVIIGVSVHDQWDQNWSNVLVNLSIDYWVDTLISGTTEANGYVQFLYVVRNYSWGGPMRIRAWVEDDTVSTEIVLGHTNEGPLDVLAFVHPDTVILGNVPDSLVVGVWFMYDFGGPANELFTLHPQIGVLSDSVLFVYDPRIEAYWYLPESLPVGRYSIIVDYSSSPCRDMSDTTWVTIVP